MRKFDGDYFAMISYLVVWRNKW